MSLTAAEVAEIMRLLEQSSFNEIKLEIGDLKIDLRRGDVSQVERELVLSPTKSNVDKASTKKLTPVADPNVHDVQSPLLGTFYRSPKPGAPPFVEVGSPVEADTVIAIIEVMKLMNTVRAGVRGVVTEISLIDGELAEYGATLMRIRKAE